MSLKPYPEYKDSGVEWIGAIPESWEVHRVTDLVDTINGFPFDASKFGPDGIPLLRIRDLNKSESETRFEGDAPAGAMVDGDDVLIGMDGDFNVGRWLGEGDALLNQRMLALRGDPLTLNLLEYALPAPLVRINDLTYATTVKHLSSGQVRSIRITLPSDGGERRSLSAFLDRETAEIDAFIADQEELIALLVERRAATISRAVTKGLDPSAPMKDSGVSWLGFLPAAWRVAPLKACATIQTGITLGKEYDDGVDYPYVRVANVQVGYVDMSDIKTVRVSPALAAQTTLRPRDVLMTEGGDLDKLGRGALWTGEIDPCLHQNHVFAARTKANMLSPELLVYLLDATPARTYFKMTGKQTTNLAATNSTLVRRFQFGLPEFEEQLQIVAHLDQEVREIDATIADARAAIALSKERRAALISAAVTGKIDVRNHREVD